MGKAFLIKSTSNSFTYQVDFYPYLGLPSAWAGRALSVLVNDEDPEKVCSCL